MAGLATVFAEVLTAHGGSAAAADADILSYIISTLEDEDFEFGKDGEDAFEAIGPFLVISSNYSIAPLTPNDSEISRSKLSLSCSHSPDLDL